MRTKPEIKKKDPENMKTVMFNRGSQLKRIGPLKKSTTMAHLKPVEQLFAKEMKNYPEIEWCYDVNAQEIPYFRTLNYTEYAHCMIIHPLSEKLKLEQIQEAAVANTIYDDYVGYFKEKIAKGSANKYSKRGKVTEDYEDRPILCVLVGSNKLKERICLNKLKYIAKTYGDEVYFKPHPITTHAFIGELKDILGDENILPREIDMYHFLRKAEKLYTTHMSESALYATVLGKEIEPIEVIQHVHQGSFYHINKILFDNCAHGKENRNFVNYTFSNYKSGIFNPEIDRDWEKKLKDYLEYIANKRDTYRTWYIDNKAKYRLNQNI